MADLRIIESWLLDTDISAILVGEVTVTITFTGTTLIKRISSLGCVINPCLVEDAAVVSKTHHEVEPVNGSELQSRSSNWLNTKGITSSTESSGLGIMRMVY